jgi:hypothetical protein
MLVWPDEYCPPCPVVPAIKPTIGLDLQLTALMKTKGIYGLTSLWVTRLNKVMTPPIL